MCTKEVSKANKIIFISCLIAIVFLFILEMI